MSVGDIIVIAVLVVILAFAIRSVIKKRGSCGCGCEGCKSAKGGSCSHCAPSEKK